MPESPRTPARFRFRPRFTALAGSATALGVAGLILAALDVLGPARELGLILGALGSALGPLYAASPAWRLAVELDDDGLAVVRGAVVRFRLRWAEIPRVVVARDRAALFVDGGEPARSLLVPGLGASAPYDLERKAELIAAILARVPAERVIEVESLEEFATSERS